MEKWEHRSGFFFWGRGEEIRDLVCSQSVWLGVEKWMDKKFTLMPLLNKNKKSNKLATKRKDEPKIKPKTNGKKGLELPEKGKN